mgnify:CR=1 FL=1
MRFEIGAISSVDSREGVRCGQGKRVMAAARFQGAPLSHGPEYTLTCIATVSFKCTHTHIHVSAIEGVDYCASLGRVGAVCWARATQAVEVHGWRGTRVLGPAAAR